MFVYDDSPRPRRLRRKGALRPRHAVQVVERSEGDVLAKIEEKARAAADAKAANDAYSAGYLAALHHMAELMLVKGRPRLAALVDCMNYLHVDLPGRKGDGLPLPPVRGY